VEAVYGRPLTVREMRRIVHAEAIRDAHQARARSESWAQWATDNPKLARLLNEAEKLNRDES